MYSPHATTEAQPVESFVVPLLSTRHLQLKCPLRHNPLGKELLMFSSNSSHKRIKNKTNYWNKNSEQ